MDTTTSSKERKYWISDCGQHDFGSWPAGTPDEDIWTEMEREGGQTREQMGGRIKTGDWTGGDDD